MHISPYIFTSYVMARRRENIHSFIAQNHFNAMDSMEKRFRPSTAWTSAETLHLICTTVIFTLYTRTTPPYNSDTHPFRTFVDISLKSRLKRLPDHGRSGPAILWPVRFALISSQGWFLFYKRFSACHVPDWNCGHSVVFRATPKMGLVPNYISVTLAPQNAQYFCWAGLLYWIIAPIQEFSML